MPDVDRKAELTKEAIQDAITDYDQNFKRDVLNKLYDIASITRQLEKEKKSFADMKYTSPLASLKLAENLI